MGKFLLRKLLTGTVLELRLYCTCTQCHISMTASKKSLHGKKVWWLCLLTKTLPVKTLQLKMVCKDDVGYIPQ